MKNILKWFTSLFLVFALFVGCDQSAESSENESGDPGISNTETASALKTAIKDVETVPETKEDFEELIGEVLSEYKFVTMGGGNSRMVSPKGTPLTDVNKIFDELKSALSDIKTIVEEGKETFTFKKSINIGEISYKDWIKLILDLYDEVSKEMGDETSEFISTKQELLKELGLTEDQLNDYATKLDKYSTIDNFYVDADIKQSSDLEQQAKFKLYTSLGVTDFNAALGVFYPNNQLEEGPVKAASAVLSYDYDISMSSNEVNYKIQTETWYKVAICTADKKGGIITFNSKSNTSISSSTDVSENDASIEISVEGNDGKKKSFEYGYIEFTGIIQSMFED